MAVVPRRPELPREFIKASRRRSFVLAAAEIAQKAGVHAVTVSRLCHTARAARNTFYDHFGGVDDCLRYGVGEALEHLFAPVREAAAEEREWLLRVERAIVGFYAAAAAEPLLAEFLLVHSAGVPREAGDPDLDAEVDAMAALLAGGREGTTAGGGPMPLADDYLTRVIISLATAKLRQDEGETLPEFAGEMTLLVGNTYLGIEETGRILGYRPGSSPK